MNASDIIRLLNSTHYPPADLADVEKLCRDYPEFSIAHLLKLRILEAQGHDKQKELKLAAVYAMNRGKLLQLVKEVEKGPEPEAGPEPVKEDTEIIQFTEESSEDADVIIAQHAPYAGAERETELLELDEQPEEELMEIMEEEAVEEEAEAEEESIQEGEEESIQEGEDEAMEKEVLASLEKDESDMEEPEAVDLETPAIDQVDEEPEEPEEPEVESDRQLISRFIREDPGPIRADKETKLKGDVSLASIKEHDGFITDTLAQIYVKQGLFAKAIYAYEKLSLKYPEKSAYFAAQIEKIRNINHS